MGLFGFFRKRKAPEPAPRPGPNPAAAYSPLAESAAEVPKRETAAPEGPAIERITARELAEKLGFDKPLIISVDGDMREIPFESRSAGKFVLCAKDERIRLFGILFLGQAYKRSSLAHDLKHRQFYQILSSIDRSYLEGYGLELGGGELKFDHGAKKIIAQGFSGTFGRPPRSFVERALEVDGFFVQAVLDESAAPDRHDNPMAVEWFRKRGVPTTDPWQSE